MSVVLARVDDRLIHGQVVVGWAKSLEADCLVVANDAVAADPMQRQLLPMAVPPHIKVAIYRVREAADAMLAGRHDERRVILLFSSLQDAAAFHREGGALPRLNLGGIRQAPGRKPLRTAVSMSEDDVAVARQLMDAGCELTVQMVPGDLPEPLKPILDQAFA
jgi:mannose/fructose/N-acetylgalactosamine-specific phosphotransferase system component IIB